VRLSPDKRGSVWGWLFLAMAHHKVGHVDVAKKWLEQSVRWLDQEIPGGQVESPNPNLGWNHRLALQLFRREAEAMIRENRALYLPVNVFQDQPRPVQNRQP
jgi:hypothetical protein